MSYIHAHKAGQAGQDEWKDHQIKLGESMYSFKEKLDNYERSISFQTLDELNGFLEAGGFSNEKFLKKAKREEVKLTVDKTGELQWNDKTGDCITRFDLGLDVVDKVGDVVESKGIKSSSFSNREMIDCDIASNLSDDRWLIYRERKSYNEAEVHLYHKGNSLPVGSIAQEIECFDVWGIQWIASGCKVVDHISHKEIGVYTKVKPELWCRADEIAEYEVLSNTVKDALKACSIGFAPYKTNGVTTTKVTVGSACECGAEKTGTSHSHWCPANREKS